MAQMRTSCQSPRLGRIGAANHRLAAVPIAVAVNVSFLVRTSSALVLGNRSGRHGSSGSMGPVEQVPGLAGDGPIE
jgi:hypothetical protein